MKQINNINMKVIEIKNVKKVYQDTANVVNALDNINLDINEGEFISIVGPSGSGKTTLLNLIGGLDKPTSGEIIIGGESLSNKSFSKLIDFRLKNIGFVFQAYNLIPVLTAKENIEFIMSLQGYPSKNKNQRANELLAQIGLTDKANVRPNKLSGGQQQRIAVARALAPKPKFIIADEPTANLDHNSAESLLEIMQKLNREEDITFIFSTHDEKVVKKAKRIIVLTDGKIESDRIVG